MAGALVRGALTGQLVLLLGSACIRLASADLTEEVDRICTAFCEQNVACHEPALFETVEDCYTVCFDEHPTIHDDTDCGAADRALYDCVANTQTCEEYLDTNNIFADDYTCKAEKERWSSACSG